jgi:thiol:disulfide interchange protein DsbC
MFKKMKLSKMSILIPAFMMLGASFVNAEEMVEKETSEPKSEVENSVSAIDLEKVKANLRPHFAPQVEIKGIEYSGVSDIYFFHVGGQALMFVNEGDYVINGGFFDMKDGANNLVDSYMSKYYVETLNSFSDEDKIIYKPEDGEVKGRAIVFTDPSCPYCTKLHNKMDEYLSYGIQIEYLPFPRGGQSGPGYTDTLKTWCADTQEKRKQLMNAAKNGNNPPILVNQKVTEECTANFQKLLDMNSTLNITGTPAVFLETGKQVGGYVEPAALFREVMENGQPEEK